MRLKHKRGKSYFPFCVRTIDYQQEKVFSSEVVMEKEVSFLTHFSDHSNKNGQWSWSYENVWKLCNCAQSIYDDRYSNFQVKSSKTSVFVTKLDLPNMIVYTLS